MNNKNYGLSRAWPQHSLILSLLLGFILLLAPQSYAQKVVDSEHRDPVIEQQLDEFLARTPEQDGLTSREALAPIIEEIDADTPLLTRIRANSYWAMEYAYEENYDKAYEIVKENEQLAERSGTADAKAEVLANRVELLMIEGKTGEAFLLIPQLERLLENVDSARIRYYGHNLASSAYQEWDRYDLALSHLLSAQKAIGEMDSELNEGRRLYLLSNIANIQSRLEQWSAAIKTVEETIPQAEAANYDGIAFGLWFTRYYAQISLKQYEQGLESLRNAYMLAVKLEDKYNEVIVLNNFGDLFMRMGRYEEAKEHLEEAKQKAAALDFKDMTKMVDFNLGFIAVRQGDSLGIKQMENVVEYFRDTLSGSQLEQFLGELATAYGLTGNYKKQAELLEERIKIKEETLRAAEKENMAELQALYKSRDKAQRIELLEQQNSLKEQVIRNNEQRTIIWILFAVVAVISTVLMVVLYRKSRRANQMLNRANAQLADQSLRDPLTGLWNRRALQEAMVSRSKHEQRSTDGLILLDIDFFKRINDKYGHAAGDIVLAEVSKRLQSVCRGSDKLIRWGGEEFLFFVKSVENDQLEQLAERILNTIGERPVDVDGTELTITATLGFIQLPFAGLSEDLVDWERALQIADMALYTGKAHGRNRACGVVGLNVDYETAHKALEHDLSAAIDEGWITVSTIQGPNS